MERVKALISHAMRNRSYYSNIRIICHQQSVLGSWSKSWSLTSLIFSSSSFISVRCQCKGCRDGLINKVSAFASFLSISCAELNKLHRGVSEPTVAHAAAVRMSRRRGRDYTTLSPVVKQSDVTARIGRFQRSKGGRMNKLVNCSVALGREQYFLLMFHCCQLRVMSWHNKTGNDAHKKRTTSRISWRWKKGGD